MRLYAGRFFAGQTLERLAAWGDGIFALAVMLIVIDLRSPINEINYVMAEKGIGLLEALIDLGPRLLVYVMSFLTLGIFWMMQRYQLTYYASLRRRILWTHAAFLVSVLLLPFSTWLLFEFIRLRLSVVVYWLNLLMLGGALFMNWNYAERLNLLTPAATPDFVHLQENRIRTCLALYTFAVLFCAVGSAYSVLCLVFFQLIIAFAPRRVLDRVF